jgi:hypothetical protein
MSIAEGVMDAYANTSAAIAAANGTVETLMSTFSEMTKRRVPLTTTGSSEWMFAALGKRQWRISCLDLLIRL